MKTILLIDDDAGIRTIFGLALRQGGYQVIEAGSGDEGYEKARALSPDLILSDVSMPGGNGQSVLQRIRHDPHLSSRQVVLMTGKPGTLNPRGGMEAGADDFLLKPFTQDALLRCVQARLERAEANLIADAKRRVPLPPHLSHEFFTPLNGIIGLTEMLVEEPDSVSLGKIREDLQDVLKTGMRLHRTLRNYLLLLQLEESSAPTDQSAIRPLSPREVKKALLDGITPSLCRTGRKNVVVEIADVSFAASAADLSIIAEELVENASNFSPFTQPVHVRLDRNHIFNVVDTGRGMPPDALRQIGAFRQFDRKKYEQQGLGLGLVLVQWLATRCRARFSIDSALGEGTRAAVAFPMPAETHLPKAERQLQQPACNV
jgi:DNA-binding response OmpR family regulator